MEPDRTCLRRARLAARIDIDELGGRTRISPALLRAIDAGEFERLPAGIYARSYVRAVAAAVGLDPATTMSELEPVLPKAASLVEEPAEPPPPAAAPVTERSSHARAASASWLASDRRPLQQALASVVDASVLCGIYAGTFLAAVPAAGLSAGELWQHGAPGIVAMWAIITAVYFVLFAGIGGSTPGEQAVGLVPESPQGAVTLATIGRRAVASFLAQASIGVDLAFRTELWSSAFPIRSAE